MTYQEVLEQARGAMGPYCKACPVCNGLACKNTVPGPGAKGIGTGFIRNYQKWQELCVNMDTICENKPVDTSFTLFGRTVDLPVFAAPVGAMTLHYGDKYNDLAYNDILSWRALRRPSPRTAAAACPPSSPGTWRPSGRRWTW